MEELSDKHFHMSSDYERHSLSQKTIGQTLIESTIEFSQSNIKDSDELMVVDLACGPGNLTIELKRNLEASFPRTKIHLSGLDYSKDNVMRLENNSKGEITGITGSFYELPIKPESTDIITSNEGLHWQPPYEMSEIIYSHLSKEEREKYEQRAQKNFDNALKNIYEALKKGGLAVLQFGHEGQLQKLWDLIRDTLHEDRFLSYKSKVNFPLYYPALEKINDSIFKAGFKKENTSIDSFNQDLTKDISEDISSFLEAFSRPGFSQVFEPEDLDAFYVTELKKN